MSLLKRPEAKALLADAKLSAASVRGCVGRVTPFLQRYLPLFYRREQRELAQVVVQGKLSDLERKTAEPIARQAGRQRKPVQHFVGAGEWDDEAIMAELRRHVAEELGADDAVFVLDGSAFPKRGVDSCGVARQWCGRLGKVDNCQVGVFLAYVAAGGQVLVDRRLYLPEAWAADRARRKKCHVPTDVIFQEKWRLGLDLIARSSADLPHAWIAADDEFGRVTAFRAELRRQRQRYVLDVPCDTLVRDLEEQPEPGCRRRPFERVAAWADRQPASRWRKFTVRWGEKGPITIKAATRLVQTKDEDGRVGPAERLTVTRTVDREPERWFTLSNALSDTPLSTLVGVHGKRHGIEEVFETGNGEVGLDHYEVRHWTGWHHHMTLSNLALWFLCLEKRRVGEKNPGVNGEPNASGVHPTPPRSAAHAPADRRRDYRSTAAERRVPHLSLVRRHETVAAAAHVEEFLIEKGLQ